MAPFFFRDSEETPFPAGARQWNPDGIPKVAGHFFSGNFCDSRTLLGPSMFGLWWVSVVAVRLANR